MKGGPGKPENINVRRFTKLDGNYKVTATKCSGNLDHKKHEENYSSVLHNQPI